MFEGKFCILVILRLYTKFRSRSGLKFVGCGVFGDGWWWVVVGCGGLWWVVVDCGGLRLVVVVGGGGWWWLLRSIVV